MAKTRLDQLLVARGLVESRARARALLMAGAVRVNGQVQTKAGTLVDAACQITLSETLPYASRGGYKLAHALDNFGLQPARLVALDVGDSTGGFTDVLLQRGAAHVYAVDVGYGLLDWRLRQDARVTLLERTNIRYLEQLPPPPGHPPHADAEPAPRAQCATVDVSFIALHLVLPALQRLITPDAWVIALVKPQFEAGPQQVGKGGVVRDAATHRAVLQQVAAAAAALGLAVRGLARSPITGPAGNVEFLVWLQPGAPAIALEQTSDWPG
jgi:23S rRNA (cytidine1920-2'-O)/16S rRNA (cytidine1409-2'-O)-methyltransferase